jgi:hypothetical protein
MACCYSRGSRSLRAVMALLFLLAGIFAARVAAQTNSTWTGGTGNWSNAGDWTAGVPNGNFNALISNGGPVSTVNLDINASIANLGLDTGNTLNILSGNTLTFQSASGSLISGGGTINLFSGGGITVGAGNSLSFPFETEATGYTLNMNGGFINGAMGGTESITIPTLTGHGTISNLQVTSFNSVIASGGTLTINPNSGGFTAGNFLQVATGSTLNITGGPFNNYNPTTGIFTLSSDGGPTVLLQGTLQFDNANILQLGSGTHVELDGPGARIVNQLGQNGLANLNNLQAGAQLTLADGAALSLNGGLGVDAHNSLIIESGSTLSMAGSLSVSADTMGVQVNHGTLNVGGNVSSFTSDTGAIMLVTNKGVLNVGGSYTNSGTSEFAASLTGSSGSSINIAGDLNSIGFSASVPLTTNVLTGASALNVGGNLNSSGNSLVSLSGGSTLNVGKDLNLTFGAAAGTTSLAPSLTISGNSTATVGGSLNSLGTITVDNTSTLTTRGGFNQTAGSTLMNGVLNAGGTGVNVQGGTFSGIGTVNGNVLMAGTMMPGIPTGTMTINGNYTQTSTGTLAEQVGWINGMNASLLAVKGTANLGGTLALSLLSGFTPTVGETFTLMTFLSDTGMFSSVILPNLGNGEQLDLVFQPTDILVEVEPASVATPEPGSPVLLLVGLLAALAVFGRRTVRALYA